MEQTRTERFEIRRAQRRKLAVVVVAVCALIAAGVAGAFAFTHQHGLPHGPRTASAEASPLTGSSANITSSVVASAAVEVPEIVGEPVAIAKTVLAAAGLRAEVQTQSAATRAKPGTVTWQTPDSGVLVTAGSVIFLRVAGTVAAAPATAPAHQASVTPTKTAPRFVVCIDPGHQAHADTAQEPIGPGSATRKDAVTGGATGVATHNSEYALALQISMRLRSDLQRKGVRVVMTRTSNDVHLTNAQRAGIANACKADLFVRVHCDSSTSPKVSGFLTLYPGPDRWTKPIVTRSREAAGFVQQAAVASTGALNRGLQPRTDLAGFNYSRVPAVLVETGMLSNADEDRKLSTSGYQEAIASGVAAGVMRYLGTVR